MQAETEENYNYKVDIVETVGNFSASAVSEWNAVYIEQMSKLFALMKSTVN